MPDNIRVYSAGPLTLIALLAIIGLIVIIVPLLFLGLAGKAITGLVGLSWLTATALVILILLCSFVDIPVWKIRRETIRMPHTGQFPEAFTPGENGGLWETTIAVNVGGAVLPLILSAYLLDRAAPVISGEMMYLRITAGILLVAAMAYATTRPVVGVGIRAPLFIPGLAALLCGILLAGGPGLSAGVIAFVSVTIGTLLGANIAHLPHVGELEVPRISIGGAGTFGAIFIGCLLSALIA
ncbi:DUF1614 domain-containing protein [Methanoregula sp.]|uniref:DUF1614 domain-containing protein n=1 Tax=Methanoregula sp. TaxID=2052170 RepID=UPI002CD22735|nr:DUF1614 domain-containing protein [Methanoregula sp.]HVP97565.1 DUF1614 domain-containing protein [Methanoregula sp.]